MHINRKIILFFIGIVFTTTFNFAFADVRINEIMYDLEGSDDGREWIEVYNDGGAISDFSIYKLFEANTNHGLVLVQGEVSIPARGYAVIVSNPETFKTDWPNYSGTIFDSSFSLGNESEALALKNESLNIVDDHTYNSLGGGAGDGKSLQLVSNSWVAEAPTPGKANETSADNNEEDTTQNTNENDEDNVAITGSSGSSSNKNDSKTKPQNTQSKPKVQITTNSIAYTEIPTLFQGVAVGPGGEQLIRGRYFWNFGDGDSREVEAKGADKFTHTYFYSGDYDVVLEYYSNVFTDTPDAIGKVSVKVVEAGVTISKVGDAKDFFIELSNNTNYDINISKWILLSDTKIFTLPQNTILGAKKKIIISSRISNFTILDKNTLRLATPQGELVFNYLPSIVSAKSNTQKSLKTVTGNMVPMPAEESLDLQALALQSDAVRETPSNLRAMGIPLISFLFILTSAGAVYFIRQKKIVSKSGEDFEILDE